MYIGIDIGGTKIAGGLVTAGGTILARAACPTPAAEGGAQVLGAAIALARSLRPAEGVIGVGVGTGGVVDAGRGVVVYASDLLPGWTGIDVRGGFERALGVPTSVDNDVNALAVGEGRFGPARGLGTVVFLALGTGVGGALLLDGRLHRGAHWGGGEFGGVLLAMDPDARPSPAGRGTLEAYASGAGLVQTWREMSGDTSPDTAGHDTAGYDTAGHDTAGHDTAGHDITGHDIAAAASLDPDGPAAASIARTGVYLGFGLVSLANALDPDLIVIGGGLAALGESLLGPARRVLQTRARPGPSACPVVPAFLGPDAALIGAAALAMGGGIIGTGPSEKGNEL